ncbi:MAG: hypothetical protein ACNA7U_03530 [Candidatus Izemoplasmataceae bacterium]|jgi:hypothetical protein|uniref:hypothetical protein n=1 Tax=Liberiplasma polymorphum TaxID=3374570 RepID=UPI00377500A9
MRKLLWIGLLFFILSSCGLKDERRTPDDAREISNNHPDFDTIHFVVSANCDYDYFFEYEPMRNGGFFAYGYKDNQPKLLIIPAQVAHEAKMISWPLMYSVNDMIDLLNSTSDEPLLSEETMYNHVRIELTRSLLSIEVPIDYDLAFFIVITVDNVKYTIIQHQLRLHIYHQDDGLIISN